MKLRAVFQHRHTVGSFASQNFFSLAFPFDHDNSSGSFYQMHFAIENLLKFGRNANFVNWHIFTAHIFKHNYFSEPRMIKHANTQHTSLRSRKSPMPANEQIVLAFNIFESLRCRSSCARHFNRFPCALRNLLYVKRLPTTGGPSNKSIVTSQNDIQYLRLVTVEVKPTPEANEH